MKPKPFLRHFLVLAAATLPISSAYGQLVHNWSGATDTNFADVSNWATNGVPASDGGPFNVRINVGGASVATPANALVYSSAQGVSIYQASGGSGGNVTGNRSLVIANGSGTSGTMTITGGTFDSRGAGRDAIANGGGNGILNISGGHYTNVNGGSDIFSLGLNFGGSATLNVNSGSFTAGTLQVGETASGTNTTGIVNLNGGILEVANLAKRQAGDSFTINFNGGTLRARQDNATFMGTADVNTARVETGGAIIDTNGFNITIGQSLVAGTTSGGGLTKQGGGTLTLGGANTYTGNTTITAGTLTLADTSSMRFLIGASGDNNSILGSGTVNLGGMFVFDLTGASTTVGDFWNIVDVGSLSESYGAGFGVSSTLGSFGETSGVWTISENNVTYEYSETTGVLSVIPEPSTALLGGLGLLVLLRRRR